MKVLGVPAPESITAMNKNYGGDEFGFEHFPTTDLKEYLRNGSCPDEELNEAQTFLKKMLEYHPGQRQDAFMLLKEPFFEILR